MKRDVAWCANPPGESRRDWEVVRSFLWKEHRTQTWESSPYHEDACTQSWELDSFGENRTNFDLGEGTSKERVKGKHYY